MSQPTQPAQPLRGVGDVGRGSDAIEANRLIVVVEPRCVDAPHDWIAESAELAMTATQADVEKMLGSADEAIRSVTTVTIGDLGLEQVDADAVFADVMEGRNLSGLLARVREENRSIARISTEVFAELGADQYNTAEVASLVQQFQAANDGSVQKHPSSCSRFPRH